MPTDLCTIKLDYYLVDTLIRVFTKKIPLYLRLVMHNNNNKNPFVSLESFQMLVIPLHTFQNVFKKDRRKEIKRFLSELGL